MVVSGLVIVAGNFRSGRTTRPGAGERFLGEILSIRIVVFAALIVGYMLALQPLGFIIASYLFLSAAMLFLYRGRILLTLAVSALSVAVIYVLFRFVFVVVLPRGAYF